MFFDAPMPETQTPSSIVAATGGLLLGGSTTFLPNLTYGLREFGEPLSVVCLSDSNEHEADFEQAAAHLFVMKDHRLIYEDRLAWAYAQIARLRPRAVVACLSSESFELLRLVPPGVMRIGLIQSDHDDSYGTAATYAPWVDTMVGVSDEISRKLQSMAEFHGKAVRTIPYGIQFTNAAGRGVRRPDDLLRVIYVGRLIEEQKRVSRIVALADRLESERAPIRLTLVGSGPQEAELRAQLVDSSVVNIFGEVSNDRVAELLREHDVFILMSDYEGLPLALLEAMGHGLVPVVSDLPSGIRQAVPIGAGIRVPIGDIDAAASALKELAAAPHRLGQMSEMAQRYARENFSAKRMAGDYLQLVEQTPRLETAWPKKVQIPPPKGLNPLLFSAIGRSVRRWLRRSRV
jgi:glycosyltransferase involved in cell wall biosynthesis